MSLSLKYELKDFNGKEIVSKFEMQQGGKTQLFLADTCFRRMHKYVPWETGTLASHVTVRPGSVTYEEEYAHKQYTTNKGKGIRGKYWDRKMVNNEKELVAQEVEAYAKKMKGSR